MSDKSGNSINIIENWLMDTNDKTKNIDKSRDNFISNTNLRNLAKNLQSQTRQPIIIKRNTVKLEKLQNFRKKLLELCEIVDLEINKTEVEWLSLTYQVEKLKNTQGEQQQFYEEHEQLDDKKVTIEEIDEQLRNSAELPDLDLRLLTNIKQQQQTDEEEEDDDEEFDTDTD